MGIHLEVKLLGHTVTLCLTFSENARMFFQSAYTTLQFHLEMYEGSNFSIFSPILTSLFYFSHPSGYEVASHYSDIPLS